MAKKSHSDPRTENHQSGRNPLVVVNLQVPLTLRRVAMGDSILQLH